MTDRPATVVRSTNGFGTPSTVTFAESVFGWESGDSSSPALDAVAENANAPGFVNDPRTVKRLLSPGPRSPSAHDVPAPQRLGK